MNSVTWIQPTDTQHAFPPRFGAPSSTAEIGKLWKQTTFLHFLTGKVPGVPSVLPVRCIDNLQVEMRLRHLPVALGTVSDSNAVFSTSRKRPRVQSPDCGWQERQWLLDTRYLVPDLICTGIFLDSAIAVAASWFSKLPGRQRCENFPGGLFCRILDIVLGDLAYGPVLHSFHQFPKYLIPYIKSRSA